MRLVILAALAFATPALADHSWSGARLVFEGGDMNGCRIRLGSASYTDRPGSQMRVELSNLAMMPVRVTGTTQLSGPNVTANGSLRSVEIEGRGRAGTTAGQLPLGASLAGSTLRVTITSCQIVR